MNTKRRRLIAAASGMALLVAVGGTARAVIPVVDGGAISELIAQIGEAEKAFALQIEQYTTEVKQYFGEEWSWLVQAQQYATEAAHYFNDAMMLTGFMHHPTLGAAMGMLNMAGLTSSLPFNPYAALNLVNGMSYGQGGFGEIGGIMNSLSGLSTTAFNANRIYVPNDGSWSSAQINAQANTIAGSQGAAMAAYADYSNHLGVLPALRQNAATAGTMKDAADTSNQLLAEIAWNENETGRAQQVATLSVLQQQARIQRDEERLACELEMFRTGGGACPSGNNGAVAGGGGGPNGGSDNMPVPPVPPLPANTGTQMAVQPDPVMPEPPAPVPPPPAYVDPAAAPAAQAARQQPIPARGN